MVSMGVFLKHMAKLVGLDIRVYKPSRSDAARLSLLFRNFGIDLVFDVGANTGQYADYLRAIGYTGKIVCFEPLCEAYRLLAARARNDTLMELAPSMALGEYDGEVKLNVASNSQSSSILEMLDSHVQVAPDSSYVEIETVKLRRLDSVAAPYMKDSSGVFLKIDAQGYENKILEGAAAILPQIKGIQVELSLVPLYAGEPLYREMIDRIEALGFELHDLNPSFADERTGRTYQVDGIFFRSR